MNDDRFPTDFSPLLSEHCDRLLSICKLIRTGSFTERESAFFRRENAKALAEARFVRALFPDRAPEEFTALLRFCDVTDALLNAADLSRIYRLTEEKTFEKRKRLAILACRVSARILQSGQDDEKSRIRREKRNAFLEEICVKGILAKTEDRETKNASSGALSNLMRKDLAEEYERFFLTVLSLPCFFKKSLYNRLKMV